LHPLPASFFKELPLPQKFNRFHIPAPCFIKNASGSSKSQMLPSSLSLLASFFKVLPLPHRCTKQLPFLQSYSRLPPDDTSSTPHQSYSTVIQIPFLLFGCFPHKHKSLGVRNDFRCVQSLKIAK